MRLLRFQQGCLIVVISTMISGVLFAKDSSQVEYPRLYAEELPRYPNARLVSIGRQVSSLRDGLRLKLTSSDSTKVITSYYEEVMKALGWMVPKQRFPIASMYIGRFTKGKLVYQLKVMRLDSNTDESQINIVYLEN